MFDQFREKIQAVQQDLTDGFKSLGAKGSKTSRGSDSLNLKHDNIPNLRDGLHISAGADLLDRFQTNWTQIHQDLEESANKANETDLHIQRIAKVQAKQLAEWHSIKKQLAYIPNLLEDIQCITAKIGKLAADFEEVEACLIELEDILEEEEHLRNEEIQRRELQHYKQQKLQEESLLSVRLQDEFNEKLQKKQKEEDAVMRERQQAFQEIFVADLNHYKEYGQMERSMSVASQETHLEDLELEWNEDDQQALDDFLGPSDDQGPIEGGAKEDVEKKEIGVVEGGILGEDDEPPREMEEPEEIDEDVSSRDIEESDEKGLVESNNTETFVEATPSPDRDEATDETEQRVLKVEEEQAEDSDEFQDAVDE